MVKQIPCQAWDQLLVLIPRGRVGDCPLVDCLSPFCFLFIEFHYTSPFLIKYYHIMVIIIVFRLGWLGRRDFFFFVTALLLSIHSSLITYVICFFILFHSCCSHAWVFEKTLVHEFLIFYSHTEWYLRFSETTWSKWSKRRLSKLTIIIM